MEQLNLLITDYVAHLESVISQPTTYMQIAIVVGVYAIAFLIAKKIINFVSSLNEQASTLLSPAYQLFARFSNLIFPVSAILLLRLIIGITETSIANHWVLNTALVISILLLFNSIIEDLFKQITIRRVVQWVVLSILFLHMIGALTVIISILQDVSIAIGNIEISLYGVFRVAIFGSLFFWLGRISNREAQKIIRRQETLDSRSKEVASKILEISITFIVFILMLQLMGINLTALAVFGGAVGVGLGIGLQSIASNFISGLIILLDKSISIEDYIELEDGRAGIVRELKMRCTTIETFDGKDIMVPNEKFIVESFTNWTHQHKKQRYRVDFSVAYHTDVRKLVDIIKAVVASHPQVISGDDLPIEERPDCEIDSFGDSGINMFVEFWMIGIDDGKNRVGGDLLLMILETIQEHGFDIPFPQREVRILNPDR